jgi:arachidonate 15-lipoxygenase
MAGSIETSRQIAIEATQGYDFDRSTPPEALATRGVDNLDALPYFPYRDDALLLWSVIRGWVESYLKIYYHSDADVQADTELQAWIGELVSPNGGRMKHVGQGGRILELEYLIRTVTHLIFLAGPQHAAVNFPQYPVMSFTPNMPLALYQPPPTGAAVTSPNGILDWFPPLDMIQIQLSLGYLLGRPQITRLGAYAATDAGDLARWVRDKLDNSSYFEDPRVTAPLAAYEAALAEVEVGIEESNRTRLPYEFLLPSRIPQSINV